MEQCLSLYNGSQFLPCKICCALFRYIDKVAEINSLEVNIANLSDAQLAAKTAEFRQMLAGGKGLDALLPEAFAVVREASRRVLNMRHFDVQLVRYFLPCLRKAHAKTCAMIWRNVSWQSPGPSIAAGGPRRCHAMHAQSWLTSAAHADWRHGPA